MGSDHNLSGTRFLENLAYLVPGYLGYKEKKQRREEDSQLRALLLHRLREIHGVLSDLLIVPKDDSERRWTEALDGRTRKLVMIADAIRYAPYGFSGFFDAEEVTEETLDRILEVDLLLFEDLDTIKLLVSPIGSPITRESSLHLFLQSLDEAILQFERHLILRDKLLGDA